MSLAKNKAKEYRKKEGISQEKLADLLGVTRQSIISIESGKYTPSLELALRMSKLFKCKVEDLFGI